MMREGETTWKEKIERSFEELVACLERKGYSGMFTTDRDFPGSLRESISNHLKACLHSPYRTLLPIDIETCSLSQAGGEQVVLTSFRLDHYGEGKIKIAEVHARLYGTDKELIRCKSLYPEHNREVPDKEALNRMVLEKPVEKKVAEQMEGHIAAFCEMMNRKGYDRSFTTAAQYEGKLKDSMDAYYRAYKEGTHASLFPVFIYTYTKGRSSGCESSIRAAFKLVYSANEGIMVKDMLTERYNREGKVVRDQVLMVRYPADIPSQDHVNRQMSGLRRKRIQR